MTENEMKLKPTEYYMIQYIKANPTHSAMIASTWLNVHKRTIASTMRSLEKKNILIRRCKVVKNTHDYYNMITNEEDWVLQ